MLLNVLVSKQRDLHNRIFELGKQHLSAINSVFNALIWIPCIFLPFLRILIIQKKTGN